MAYIPYMNNNEGTGSMDTTKTLVDNLIKEAYLDPALRKALVALYSDDYLPSDLLRDTKRDVKGDDL